MIALNGAPYPRKFRFGGRKSSADVSPALNLSTVTFTVELNGRH
jgi:hypothetical protein